jgi:hypothetical protein
MRLSTRCLFAPFNRQAGLTIIVIVVACAIINPLFVCAVLVVVSL